MYCYHCKREIIAQAKFCPYCGSDLTAPPAQKAPEAPEPRFRDALQAQVPIPDRQAPVSQPQKAFERKAPRLWIPIVILSCLVIIAGGILAAVFLIPHNGEKTPASSTSKAASTASTQRGALKDNAKLFSAEQTEQLQQQLDTASAQTGWQFIIHTSEDNVASEDMQTTYDNYFASHPFAFDSIMLVIDNASNNRIILSYGDVPDYFNDGGERYNAIIDAMRPSLSSGDLFRASEIFIEKASAVHDMGKPKQ